MSGIIVGLVLRTPITKEFNAEAKFIATVYADHAWEDGTHAYPAVETVADIVGLHERTVQRYLRLLEGIGMLIPNGKGPRGTNKYDFPLEAGKDGSVRLVLGGGGTVPPLEETEEAADSGGTQPPWQAARGDTVSGDTVSGDTTVSPEQTTRPVLVVVNADVKKIFDLYANEFGAPTPMIADAIRDAIDTYPPDWIPEAMQIAVESNKRSWKYVEGILKNCAAKKIRPSLNKLESKYAAHKKGVSTGTKTVINFETDAAKLAEINRRHGRRKGRQSANVQ